jgi:ketosteroid isomerase-like protein
MSRSATHTSPSKPVNCYFEAVAAHDSKALADCFADDGVVLDVDRTISGREAIKMWAD